MHNTKKYQWGGGCLNLYLGTLPKALRRSALKGGGCNG